MESAAGGPFGGEGHGAGFEEFGEGVEELVGEGFVEDALVAVGLEVELVGFEFDAEFIGDVREFDGAEVRVAGDGADRGEFRGDVEDGVVALGGGIGEGDEEGGGVVGHKNRFKKKWIINVGYSRRRGEAYREDRGQWRRRLRHYFLCAFGVAVEVDVEAGGEAVLVLFAEVGEPEGAGGEGLGLGAFGHEEDVLGVDVGVGGDAGVDLVDEGVDFFDVGWGGEDEFPLAVEDEGAGGELLEDGKVKAVFFVGLGEAAVIALEWGGVF